jgi:hypothetical protein
MLWSKCKEKINVKKRVQRIAFSAVAFGICLMISPVLAQGPGVQVIRMNVRDEPASPPAVSPVPSSARAVPPNGAGIGAATSPSTTSIKSPGGQTLLTAGASVGSVELANVRDILLDVRRAQAAAVHLYGEVTRHPITGYSYADAMGPVMIEIPMPTFDMSQVLPARRQWVELYMGEISSVLTYVKNDMDSIKASGADLSLPAKDKPTFEKDLADASASIDRTVSYGEQLKKLTVAPPYDNVAIAKLISPLHKDWKEVEKTSKRLIGQIKKSH